MRNDFEIPATSIAVATSDPLGEVTAFAPEERQSAEEDQSRDGDRDRTSAGTIDLGRAQIIRTARSEHRVTNVLHDLYERIQEGDLLRPCRDDADRIEDRGCEEQQ